MYMMQALQQVRETLEADALNRAGTKKCVPEYDSYYQELFRTISEGHGQQQPGWRYCLTEGELTLLAENIYKCNLPVEPLIRVFEHTGSFQYIEIIYRNWQKYSHIDDKQTGDNSTANNHHCDDTLFRIIASDRNMNVMFKERYKISPEDIISNIHNNTLVKFLSEQARYNCDGTYTGFAQALAGFGLIETGWLYIECMKRFMLVCNGKAYMGMGCDKTHKFFDELPLDDRKAMTHNMLRVMDEFQLRTFVSFAPIFRELIGNEGSETYKEIVEPLPANCRHRYTVMQNQYLIYNILGDSPRADFWMVYADKGIIRVNEPTSTLFLEFPGFTVIEFRNADAAYFFNNEYMKEVIINRIADIDNEEELEQWLYNNTEWSLDKEHRDHWRKAHVGNWQLDMKSYMSHNLRK